MAMFNNCTKLTNLNLRNFNTDNIKKYELYVLQL